MPFSSLKRGGGRGQGWWDKRLRTYFNTADYVWNSVTQGLDYFYGVMPLSFSLSLSLLDQVFSTEKKERQKSLWVRLDSVKFPEDWNFVFLTSLRYSNIRIWRFKIYIGIKMDVLKRNAYSLESVCWRVKNWHPLIPKIENAWKRTFGSQGNCWTFRVQRYCRRVEMANEWHVN